MQKKVSKFRKQRGQPRSAQEINNIMNEVERRERLGIPYQETSAKLNIPLASIYRWRRHRQAEQVAIKFKSLPTSLNIDETLDVLSNTSTDKIDFITNLLFFINWMRWPTRPELHEVGTLSLCMRYVNHISNAVYVHELTPQERTLFERFMRIEDLIKIMSLESPIAPYLDEFYIDEKWYTVRDVWAEAIMYMLSCDFDLGKPRLRPSLSKAFYLLKWKALHHEWDVSERKYELEWQAQSPATPFMFVEHYSCDLEWPIETEADVFLSRILDLIERPVEVAEFIAKAKWVTQELRMRLDPRAFENAAFPRFPQKLEPMRVPLETLSDTVRDMLSDFR